MCLGIQLITGIALAMHYTPHVDLAFFKYWTYHAWC
jgi:quinol-cytochrome oxidoreductase complex cytochrome b subunit